MSELSDSLVNVIADGTGRVYPSEGKSLAIEVRMWRKKARDAAQAARAQHNVSAQSAAPFYPWGYTPPPTKP